MNFVTLCLLLVFSSKVLAQTEEEFDTSADKQPINPTGHQYDARETHILLSNLQEPNEHVIVKNKLLLQHNNSKIYPGDVVSALIGFENTGKQPLFITDICAAVTAPFEPTNYLRNYSAVHHNISVRGSEVHSLEYPFMVDSRTNPLEYGLVVVVFYTDVRGNEFSSVVYNSTFAISEAPSTIDTRTFLIIVGLLAAGVTAAILFRDRVISFCTTLYRRILSGSFTKSRKSSKGSSSENSQGQRHQNCWISGPSARYLRRSSVKRATSASPAPAPGREKTQSGKSPTHAPAEGK